MHRREPEAGREVVHVAGVEAIREHLGEQGRPRTRQADDEDERVLELVVTVELELARPEVLVQALQEVLGAGVLGVRTPALGVEIVEARPGHGATLTALLRQPTGPPTCCATCSVAFLTSSSVCCSISRFSSSSETTSSWPIALACVISPS